MWQCDRFLFTVPMLRTHISFIYHQRYVTLATDSTPDRARLFFLCLYRFLRTSPAQLTKYLWEQKNVLDETLSMEITYFKPNTPVSICLTIFKMTEHLVAKATEFLRHADTF
jgi:hypothetical protein